jgi:hypothetical protein
VCTVLLRFAPGTRWPVLVGAVRDEFMARPWDPPAEHWPHLTGAAPDAASSAGLVGGRDRVAGGTWLAVDPAQRTLSALLNGPVRLPLPADGRRPSRGDLPLHVLTHPETPALGLPAVERYDSFHLVRAAVSRVAASRVEVWSWNGTAVEHGSLAPGDHVIVNDGVDAVADPLVPFVRPVLNRARTPDPRPGLSTAAAWGDWVDLMAGGDLEPTDPRALIVRHQVGDRVYGSTSVTLVALDEDGVRYDFTANPGPHATWSTIVDGAR